LRERMDNNDQYDTGNYVRDKRPWFGPKRLGWGCGPRTWQGYLVSAILVLYVILMSTLTKGHMPGVLFAIVPAIAVPFIIMAIQRR
jgi:hypothetical protein